MVNTSIGGGKNVGRKFNLIPKNGATRGLEHLTGRVLAFVHKP